MSESQTDRYRYPRNCLVSSNLSSLDSFENISGNGSAPCLVLKESQEEVFPNKDAKESYSDDLTNNSKVISTAMTFVEKYSEISSDSPPRVHSKLDYGRSL